MTERKRQDLHRPKAAQRTPRPSASPKLTPSNRLGAREEQVHPLTPPSASSNHPEESDLDPHVELTPG